MKTLAFIAMAALTVACTADSPASRSNNNANNNNESSGLRQPLLEAVPASTPLSVVAIRGSTEGARIIVRTPNGEAHQVSVLPGGRFCIDVPLQDGPNQLEVVAVGGDGKLSESLFVDVERNSSASTPTDPTCSGTTEPNPECAAQEVCGTNGNDEDCNGFADACDSSCNGCSDDVFEPNDGPADVPTIPAGTHSLELCPCREDWFAFHVNTGQYIRATATFDSVSMNLNMRLYKAGATETIDTLTGSYTATGTEAVEWRAETPGTYYLRIYVFGEDPEFAEGTYNLTVN